MPRGFVLQPTYRIQSGRAVVHLFGKLETGETFLVRDDRSVPRFFVRRDDADRARELRANVQDDGVERVTMKGEPVVPVVLRQPGDTPAIRERLFAEGIVCYEADVRFAYRFLIDRGIRASLQIEGEWTPGEGIGRVYHNPKLAPADWTPTLSILSIDIETDPQAQRLLSVALVGAGLNDVLLLTPPSMSCPPGAIPASDETELLQMCVDRIRLADPDVITGWSVVDFDLTVLQRMAGQRGVPFLIGRGRESLRIRPAATPRGNAQASIEGRVVLDGIDLLRGAFVRMDSYALNAVASEIVGKEKIITGPNRAEEILTAFREDREKLVEYNRLDAQLVLDILGELKLEELTVQRSLLTGMPCDRVAASIASFDFLYLSELGKRNIVAPTVRATGGFEAQTGGHVLEPRPGLYRNVLVLDFKSLYPSIIRTFNIDPLGHLPFPEPADDAIVAPNGAAFRREPGILPAMLAELFPRRQMAQAAGNKVASQAIKILMNSFYGVLGTPACRFAKPALANAITGFGREILLWSKDALQRRGLEVLYGDTDSLFVLSGEDDGEAARSLGEGIVEELNGQLAQHVERTWRVTSHLQLEFEKLYLRLLLPSVRHGQGGARKRYAGLVDEGRGPEVVFTGLEVVRRDWTELAKVVQRQLYARLFADQPVEEYLHQTVAELRGGRLDDLLVYRKAIRKNLDDYTATNPPHVVAARKLGGKPPRIVEYFITEQGAEPVQMRTSAIDHEHYVQRQVRPVAEPVLELLGLEFDKVIGDDTQLQLF